MYQLLLGKPIKLRLACKWVKCGFSSAATSAFYTFKIHRSASPQIRILPPAYTIVWLGLTSIIVHLFGHHIGKEILKPWKGAEKSNQNYTSIRKSALL